MTSLQSKERKFVSDQIPTSRSRGLQSKVRSVQGVKKIISSVALLVEVIRVETSLSQSLAPDHASPSLAEEATAVQHLAMLLEL